MVRTLAGRWETLWLNSSGLPAQVARLTGRRTRDGFPVLPLALPVVGHLLWQCYDTVGLLREASHSLGPLFWTHVGFGHEALACVSPEGIEIFKNRVTTSTHYQRVASALLGGSLLVHDGARHHHMRSAMNGPFTPRGLAAAEVGPVLASIIEERVRRWPVRAAAAPLRVLAETRELALDLIFRMMGISDEELSPWRHHYEEYMLAGLNVPIDLPGFPRWRARRAQGWLDERLRGLVHAARAAPEPQGLLWHIVHSRDEEGQLLSDQELLDNLRLLALAGHETTATVMAWMALHLSQDPAVLGALTEEAAAAGALPRSPRELKGFPVAEAVFRETLRLHPPVSVDTREVTGELELGGRTIRPGIEVALYISNVSRHPDLFEAPDEFRLSRWLDRAQAPTPLELVQFGGGPHFCLGYHVAWMESVQFAVALALALRAAGRRLLLRGPWPRTHYLPLAHPDPAVLIGCA